MFLYNVFVHVGSFVNKALGRYHPEVMCAYFIYLFTMRSVCMTIIVGLFETIFVMFIVVWFVICNACRPIAIIRNGKSETRCIEDKQ